MEAAALAAAATVREIAPAARMMTRRVVLMGPCFRADGAGRHFRFTSYALVIPPRKTPQVTAWFPQTATPGPEYRLPVPPERRLAGSRSTGMGRQRRRGEVRHGARGRSRSGRRTSVRQDVGVPMPRMTRSDRIVIACLTTVLACP